MTFVIDTVAGWLAAGRKPGRERLASLGLALVLAFVVWLSSVARVRPITKVTLPAPDSEVRIEIVFVGLDENLAWYRPDQRSVKVELRGVEDELKAMRPEDLVASVDLSDVGPDDTNYEGRVVAHCRQALRCIRRGIRIASVKPDSVGLRVAPRTSRSFEIDVELGSDPPLGYSLTSRQAMPGRARVLGAGPQVERVDRVAAPLASLPRLNQRSLVEGVRLVALDAFGREVTDVLIDPIQVDVDLRVEQQGEPVFVLAGYTGAPAEGYRVVGFEVEPETVQLAGSSEAIDALRDGLSPSVDVSGITSDLVERVPLALPEGVEAVNAPDGVTVTVRVKPLQGTRSLDIPVRILSIPAGFSAQVNPARVRVLVGGAQPLLDAIREADMEAFIDLTGREPGAGRLAPTLRLPEGVREISITPLEIEVNLTRDGSTPATATARAGTGQASPAAP